MGVLVSQALVSGILMGLVFSLIALGLTIIFGVMNIVNFAHGEFLMIGMYAAYWSAVILSMEPLLTLPIAAAVGFVLGIASYYLLVKRLLRGPMIAQLLGTFGLMLFLRYLAMFIWGPNFKTLHKGLLIGKTFMVGPIIIDGPKFFAGLLSLAGFLLVYWLISYTKTGKALLATSIDAEAASYMGIKTEWMNGLAWGLGGATVGIAGALLINFYYVYPTIGILFCMLAFATVALGGFGSIKGAFLAGLIIGVIETLFGQFVAAHFKFTVIYALYFLVVALRPEGMFGWK